MRYILYGLLFIEGFVLLGFEMLDLQYLGFRPGLQNETLYRPREVNNWGLIFSNISEHKITTFKL